MVVSMEDSHLRLGSDVSARYPRRCYYYTPPPSFPEARRSFGGRSMRTFRSNMFQVDRFHPIPDNSSAESEIVSYSAMRADNMSSDSNCLSSLDVDGAVDASRPEMSCDSNCLSSLDVDNTVEASRPLTDDFSACTSNNSRELLRLSMIPDPGQGQGSTSASEPEPCSGFLQREASSTEIIESIAPEDLQPTVKLCVDGLHSSSIDVKRSAAAKLRILAKNRSDNRALIGESGAVPALIPLLRCSNATAQEHAVTALLNLSLHESNNSLIINAGGVKSLIYVLKTGTEISKQNAACCLLNVASSDRNKLSIGASGAIPPLIALLKNGSNRGKKDSLTTLYKLCSVRLNKDRAVTAGAMRPILGLVGERDTGLAEKAMVVLSSLAGIEMGRETIVKAGGMALLVEAIEYGSDKVKEFAVSTLLQLCGESVANRGLLVEERGIPPLVALSLTGKGKARHKAKTLVQYLRESRMGASSSSP